MILCVSTHWITRVYILKKEIIKSYFETATILGKVIKVNFLLFNHLNSQVNGLLETHVLLHVPQTVGNAGTSLITYRKPSF